MHTHLALLEWSDDSSIVTRSEFHHDLVVPFEIVALDLLRISDELKVSFRLLWCTLLWKCAYHSRRGTHLEWLTRLSLKSTLRIIRHCDRRGRWDLQEVD